jgi:hypothetical protein
MRFKHIFIFTITISLTLLFSSCNKGEKADDMSIEELETLIRSTYDAQANKTNAEYEELLNELSKDKYIVLPMYQMIDTVNPDKVIVCLRHDVDAHPFKALELATMEYLHGISSTYFFLSTATYYGTFTKNGMVRHECMKDIYQKISYFGHEIGIHNDLLAVMIEHNLDPFVFSQEEIAYYNSLGITIYGTASHGSSIARETVANYQIFSDFSKSNYVEFNGTQYPIGMHSLADYGFKYEAYFINDNKSFSDSGENGMSQVEALAA